MLRHRVGAVCLAVLGLLAFPREGSAHILDIIWEMSGPQMIGIVTGCDYDKTNGFKCRIADKFLDRERVQPDWHSFWLVVDAGLYGSTTKNSDTQEFDWFKTGMVAVEPMVMRGSLGDGGNNSSSLYHAAGISYDLLFGKGFSPFDKFAFKFVPIGYKFKSFSVAYTLRAYHNGFTPDEFGEGDRQDDLDRPFEVVHGISFGFTF